jgi:hypothetical protein
MKRILKLIIINILNYLLDLTIKQLEYFRYLMRLTKDNSISLNSVSMINKQSFKIVFKVQYLTLIDMISDLFVYLSNYDKYSTIENKTIMISVSDGNE